MLARLIFLRACFEQVQPKFGAEKIAEHDVKLQNYASVKIKKTSRELQQGVSMETFC